SSVLLRLRRPPRAWKPQISPGFAADFPGGSTSGQLERHALAGKYRRLQGRAGEPSGTLFELFERVIRMLRIVVEQAGAPRAARRGEREGVGDARMSPADLGVVFLLAVLGVVQHDVGVAGEGAGGDPVRRLRIDAGQGRLVIGQIGEARSTCLEPEAE